MPRRQRAAADIAAALADVHAIRQGAVMAQNTPPASSRHRQDKFGCRRAERD